MYLPEEKADDNQQPLIPHPDKLFHMLEVLFLPFLFILFMVGFGLLLRGKILFGIAAITPLIADIVSIALLIKNRHQHSNEEKILDLSMNPNQQKRYFFLRVLTGFAVSLYLVGFVFEEGNPLLVLVDSAFMVIAGIALIFYIIHIAVHNAHKTIQKIKIALYGLLFIFILVFSIVIIYFGATRF